MHFITYLDEHHVTTGEIRELIEDGGFGLHVDEARQRQALPGEFHLYVGDGEITLTLTAEMTALVVLHRIMEARQLEAARLARRVTLEALKTAFNGIADDESEPSALADEVARAHRKAEKAVKTPRTADEVFGPLLTLDRDTDDEAQRRVVETEAEAARLATCREAEGLAERERMTEACL